MKHEFFHTIYQEDGVFNVGIKCNRPFRVTIGDDDTTYDNNSDYDGDGEHIIYMQFPFDVDVRVENGLIDIDGRRLIVEVFDFGLWDLTLDEKKNALSHNGHLKNLWIENDFTQMLSEDEDAINKLISELEDLFSDTIPSSVYQPSLKGINQ